MKKQPVLILAAILFLVLGFILVVYLGSRAKEKSISNFAECAASGRPVMESYPRQCSANGQTFTEIITP